MNELFDNLEFLTDFTHSKHGYQELNKNKCLKDLLINSEWKRNIFELNLPYHLSLGIQFYFQH
jgi:hypothetical protein